MPPNLDAMCGEALRRSANLAIPWWLMAGYCYHIHHGAIISDGLFDWMARVMLTNWPNLHHRHKGLIQPADLAAGSLYRLRAADYPAIVRGAACQLVRDTWGVRLNEDKDLC